MKKVITIGICVFALTLFFFNNTQAKITPISLASVFNVSTAMAEEEEKPKYNKVETDCTITITATVEISGSWMGITYTCPADGSISLTCGKCDVNCPAGKDYYRADCTTKDCE